MKRAAHYAIVVVLSCSFALGQQYKVLWTFGSVPNDGLEPVASLISDAAGNLYGTTQFGGTSTVDIGGTVFELSPQPDGTWTETVLYNFCTTLGENGCLDGGSPQAGLTFDAQGNLYGTTAGGGANYCPSGYPGCGTVFELSPPLQPGGPWTESVLYSFCSVLQGNRCLDGQRPLSQPVFDASGNLYGTAAYGGNTAAYGGVVFELSPGPTGWIENVLYNFCTIANGDSCADGAYPAAGVTFDKSGNLYGTTELGGALHSHSQGAGTVYKLSPGSSGWTENVLFVFPPPAAEGAGPVGSVTFDRAGNLYSTTEYGGQSNAGTVFRLSPKGDGTFSAFSFDGSNGNQPAAGVLVDSRRAAVYGTTSIGGTEGCGTVFKIVPPAQETLLYSFSPQSNYASGCVPLAGLIQDASGNLYGTTKIGGANITTCGPGCGVVFEIAP